MATHRLDELVSAVRTAALGVQRMLVVDDIARRHGPTRMRPVPEQDLFPADLLPATSTRLGRLCLDIPVSVTEMPDPAHPWRRILALVLNGATAAAPPLRLSIDVTGETLQKGSVRVDDLILNSFETLSPGDETHDQT